MTISNWCSKPNIEACTTKSYRLVFFQLYEC
jgi:hypothetical protein